MPLLVGRCLPGRRRERRRKLQPPLSKGQPSHAALTQSGCQRRSQNQRKHLRDRVSPLGPAPGTQSSHRGDCPSTVPTDLADPAPGSPLRGTGPGLHQTVKQKRTKRMIRQLRSSAIGSNRQILNPAKHKRSDFRASSADFHAGKSNSAQGRAPFTLSREGLRPISPQSENHLEPFFLRQKTVHRMVFR